jgi:hypothetical protein
MYAKPNIILAIKSGKIRWAENIPQMEEINAYNILVRKPEWTG